MSNLNASLDNDIKTLYKHSRFLRKIAWIVELIVVFIGLCISVSLLVDGDNLVSKLTLSAPFVMISLVELTKIPFVIGLWNAKKSFLMYLIIISFLCIITFETLLNGFERAFSSINNQINLNEISIGEIENKIQVNEENILLALEDYQSKTQSINVSRDVIAKNFDEKFASAAQTNKNLSKEASGLKIQLDTAREELIQLKVEKSDLLKELSEKKEERFQTVLTRSQDSVNLAQQERTRLLDKIESLRAEKDVAVEESNFFTSNQVKREYDEKIRYAEDQLANINDKTITGEEKTLDVKSVEFLDSYYADLLNLKQDMISQKQENIDYINDRYVKAISASDSSLSAHKAKLEKEKNTALGRLNQQLSSINKAFAEQKRYINDLKKENNQLRFDIRVVESETNTLALSNQIYRMASYVDNVTHYKEIKKDTLTLVGLIWFGSLAFIGSITGIALTLSGLHLNRLAGRKEEAKAKALLANEPTSAT
ncbi:hypothetical protein TW85_17525 [Marinomonas sp. S3726]|uniref:hypothetical protein n=1 Tax=Marinomonas sp. S3726 TaxID=579484 RepID=UPI0005FA4BBE|nr:hypothetical protein [Marinomonas sp. S3726]KJZ11237.1 hypothetical protein TW85_17525 [Marinomonas sp. S3726]